MFKPIFLAVSLSLGAAAWAEPQLDEATKAYLDQLVEQKVQQALKDHGLQSDQLVQTVGKALEQYSRQRQAEQRLAEQHQRQEQAKLARAVDSKRDKIRGNMEAEYSLIEYSDFECPYCKRFHQTAMTFSEAKPEVNWVYRHYPLAFHDPLATKEALASECAFELAGQDGFWQYADAVYDRTRSNNGLDESQLYVIANDIKLDAKAFEQCYQSERHLNWVKEDLANGNEAGVTGTPGSILRHNPTGEVMVIVGAQPLANLEAAFTELKAKVAAMR